MLRPFSQRFFIVEHNNNTFYIPFGRVESIKFDPTPGEVTINLAGALPTVTVSATQEQLERTLLHRDYVKIRII